MGGSLDTGFEIDEAILEDLKVLGATEEVLANARHAMAPAWELEVFEDNLQAIEVFKRMQTQWSMGTTPDRPVPIGLRYEALPIVMRRCKVERADFDQVFDDVQIMEEEALKVFLEKASE